jgi:hypothetical protein
VAFAAPTVPPETLEHGEARSRRCRGDGARAVHVDGGAIASARLRSCPESVDQSDKRMMSRRWG